MKKMYVVIKQTVMEGVDMLNIEMNLDMLLVRQAEQLGITYMG